MKNTILILLLMFCGMCYAFDNGPAQFPSTQFQSVNNVSYTTTYEPHITPVGSSTPYGTPVNRPGRIRKVGIGDDPGDPMQTPITDVPIIFTIVFLSIYLFYKKKQYEKLDLERMDCSRFSSSRNSC